jgi:RecB family exonuclease
VASRVIGTGYGRAALDALRSVVAELKADDPMAPVTIILPTNLAGIVARRYLAAGLLDGRAGIAALHLTTLPRLAEQLAAPSLTPRRPATRPVVAAAWRRALDRDPGAFVDVADHPATVRALADVHRELRDLSPAALDAIEHVTTITPSAVALHRDASAIIHKDHYDPIDLLDQATALVAERPSRIAEHGGLILYLPQDLLQAETRFTNALAGAADLTVIAGLTGVLRADRPVERTLSRLSLGTPDRPSIPVATHLLNASDSDDEIRCIVRRVVETLQHTPAHRVAVLYAAASPYGRLLHEHLEQAGITVNGAGTRPVNERATTRTLLEVLALAAGDVPRADLFRALANAPTRDFDGERIPVARWERTSRNAGVVSGDDWDSRLGAYITTQQATIAVEQDSDDPQSWRASRAARAVETARALGTFVDRLRAELHTAQLMTSWRELADWCQQLMTTLIGEGEDLRRLPVEEQYAAATVTSLLHGLGSLDAVDSGASFQALTEVLDLELSSALPRVGRFGDGILVAPLSHAIGLEVDVVYVVGLAEDIYPGRLHEDALLPERVRAAAGGELASYRERLHTRQRHLLAAFAAGSERTVASFPRGDLRRSSRRLPSRWLLPSLRELTGDHELAASDWEDADYPPGTMAGSGSFAGELLTTGRLSHEQEWRVRQARAARDLDDDVVHAGVAMIRDRASTRFTRYDGNLVGADGLPDYADGERIVSPTALESYAECPHAFFVRRLLGVEPIEQPEDIVTISPAEIGNLVHQSLDTLVTEAGDALPDFGEPWTPAERARLAEIALGIAAEFEERGITGHPRLWAGERIRILSDLARLLDDDNMWRADVGARVAASELTFGMRGHDPVEVAVPGGGVLMRGSADKVDIGTDGTLYVTDVKTGSRRTFKEIKQEDPFVDGTKLQLPVYAYAARQRLGDRATPVHATYWFVRKDRGRIGIDLTLDVEQQYAETLATLVSSIRTGLFPLRSPDTPDFAWVQCPYCNPDGIGHGDNRERWERKRLDPVLREYLALVEPDVVAEAET